MDGYKDTTGLDAANKARASGAGHDAAERARRLLASPDAAHLPAAHLALLQARADMPDAPWSVVAATVNLGKFQAIGRFKRMCPVPP
jgi:hypothetical protein